MNSEYYRDYTGIILELYWSYTGVIQESCTAHFRIAELTKKLKSLKDKKKLDSRKRKKYVPNSSGIEPHTYQTIHSLPLLTRYDKTPASTSKQLKLPELESGSLRTSDGPSLVSMTVMKGSNDGDEE